MLNFSEVGDVKVTTSQNSSLGPSHWAERAADKIISVGKTAHPTIKDYIYKAVQYFIWEAIKEDRSKVITLLRSAGHNDLANSVEKL